MSLENRLHFSGFPDNRADFLRIADDVVPFDLRIEVLMHKHKRFVRFRLRQQFPQGAHLIRRNI